LRCKGRKSAFFRRFYRPQSRLIPSQGMFPYDLGARELVSKHKSPWFTRRWKPRDLMFICLHVVAYRFITDRRTDGQTDGWTALPVSMRSVQLCYCATHKKPRQTDRQTNTQTNKQTNRRTDGQHRCTTPLSLSRAAA